MPITPDDFDWQPPATSEPPAMPAGIPADQPPARVAPAVPAKRGVPRWVTLLAVLVIVLIFLFSLVSKGVQPREVTATGPSVIETPVIETSVIDTMATTTSPRLERGVRRYAPAPWHLSTWPFGPGAGAGVDIVLSGVIVRDHETLVTFDVGCDHHDVVLYGRLYLIVDGATTLQSTSGLEGGRQSSFNIDGLQQIDVLPGEHVVLLARFPPLPDDAKSLKFISPTLHGWQSEWGWEHIELREIAVPEDR